MPQFRYAHAAGGTGAQPLKLALRSSRRIGQPRFPLRTDAVADHLLKRCRYAERRPAFALGRQIGLGVCATAREYLDEPAVAAMVCDFEPDAFKVFSGISTEEDVRRLDLKCGGSQAAFAIVHVDPLNPRSRRSFRSSRRSSKRFSARGSHELARAKPADRRSRDDGGISGVAFADT